MDRIVVFSTCGSKEEAGRLAERLVQERLAACVNVIAPVRSYYRWRGKMETAAEWMLLIKTSRPLFGRVQALLQSAHSYALPEVIAVPMVEGSKEYLAWFDKELLNSEPNQ